MGPFSKPASKQKVSSDACTSTPDCRTWELFSYLLCLERRDPMPRASQVFYGCVKCGGKKGCPRNGKGGVTCSASACKRARAEEGESDALPSTEGISMDMAQCEMMPPDKWIQELEEILGERCCELRTLSHKKRKNGPGTSYCQQFLVRGKFLEDDGDDNDDEDTCAEWNTYWIKAVDLEETIAKADIKEALVARHERVLGDI